MRRADFRPRVYPPKTNTSCKMIAMNQTLCLNTVDLIAEQADQRPEALAIVRGEHTWTYAELVALMDDVAQRLQATGALSADTTSPRIGLACPDGLAYIVLALGLLRAGACVVPIASELSRDERLSLTERLALTGLVIGGDFDWPEPPGRTIDCELPTLNHDATAPTAKVQVGVRTDDSPSPDFDPHALAALNPAFIRFSSGTTGKSKGVVISHATLIDRVAAANEALRITPDDRVIWILPMAHHFAVSMMLYLTRGATTVVVGSHLGGDVLDAAHEHRGTVLYAAPFHHNLLVKDKSGRDWPGLRLAVSTAAALPVTIADAFHKRFGIPLTQALGIIEAGLPAINITSAADKPSSIGRPTPGFEIELRDENGQVVPDNGVGELHLRGPGIFDAYLLPWRYRTEVLDAGGWFRTGDLAKRDTDGDLFLVGRSHSVINVAGLKVFPEEVEAVLIQHEQVKEVRVFGRDHPQVGAVPAAEIVPIDPTHPPKGSALAGFCKNKLATYKRPIQFTFVDALPKTPSGKIKR